MNRQVERQSKLKIFTWHIHGSYLFYLSQGDYDIYIPVNQEKSEGYYGKGNTFPFGDHVHEVQDTQVKNMEFDLILFQTDENYLTDQYQILSEQQRKLPKVYLEHDPPWGHPTNNLHPVNDPDVLVVHVTYFNQLMWDNHGLKTKVILHGVIDNPVEPVKKIERGITVINNLKQRGRLLGADIYEQVSPQVAIDIIGMGTAEYGLGEILHPHLPAFIAQYQFFFNPIRYTSLGLAVCEAMMLGLPVVGLATTEMAVVIKNGYSGFIHTNPAELVKCMHFLLAHPLKAKEMGENARAYALEHFNIRRFVLEWKALFDDTIKQHSFKTV